MFGDLESLRQKPIPEMTLFLEKHQSYRQHAIDLTQALIAEPLVDAEDYNIAGENYYYKLDNPPYYERIPRSIPELKLRETVAKKLSQVNETLLTVGLELYLFDAYRPIEVQNYFYNEWFPAYLKRIDPSLSGEKLEQEVSKYWAKGAKSSSEIDPHSPPPHSTGGAIDLTIRKVANGEHLYMGSIFDDVTEVANIDYLEKAEKVKNLNFSETEALKNRRLLHWLLCDLDFSFNPTEWWHFSWGDQLWARMLDKKSAVYSFAGYRAS